MQNKVKGIILLHNVRFFARKIFRFVVVILLFYCFYYFLKRQDEFIEFLKKADNRLMRFYEIVKKNACKNISINGIKYSNYTDIQNHINKYCSNRHKNIKDLKSSIENDIWIKDAKILIKLPSGIVINIVEYNPFALITNDGINYKLIDEFGNFINVSQDEIITFGYLLKIVGFDVKNYEINNLFNMLSIHYKIAKNVNSVVRIGDRRWDIILSDNIIAKMPEENNSISVSDAWDILDNIINVPEILSNLKEIDIRNQDKIYLKYNDMTFKKIINL